MTVKYVCKYTDEIFSLVYYKGYYSGIKKKHIVRWCDICTNRMIDGVTVRIILSVTLSVIFNLWPDDRSSSPPPSFLLFSYAFFFTTNSHPLPSHFNRIQPPTTTLGLSASVFWFKIYWGFSTLSKQIYLFFYLNTILQC